MEAWHTDEWPEAKDLAALVVMGGTMNVDALEAYPFLDQSRRLMAAAIDAEIPTLGVCLGSQMMARVLGAEVFRAEPRNAMFSGLKLTDVGVDDPIVSPFASGLPVLQFHEDTFEVPPDAIPLATSDASGTLQAFRFGDTAYAIQFHFEVDEPILAGWIDDIGPAVLESDWDVSGPDLRALASRHIPGQSAAGRELVGRFLDLTV